MSLSDSIAKLLENLAAVATILGFSLIGVLAACRWFGMWAIKGVVAWLERRKLGQDYDLLKDLAVRDGCFDPKSSVSLQRCLTRRAEEVDALLRSELARGRAQRVQRLASGSSQLSYRTLLDEAGLQLTFVLTDRDTGRTYSDRQIIDATGLAQPALIVGEAGSGKSFLLLKMEGDGSQDPARAWVLLITPEDFWNAGRREGEQGAMPGSQQWCIDLFLMRSGLQQITALQRRLLAHRLETTCTLLIDGLDEIAERLGRTQMATLIESWMFSRARAMSARSAYYRSELSGHLSLRGRAVLEVEPPSFDRRLNFAHTLCERLHGKDARARYAAVRRVLTDTPQLREIVNTPLMLLMLTDIPDLERWARESQDHIGVYEAFQYQSVLRDASRLHDGCTPEDVLRVFRELAWTLFRHTVASSGASSTLGAAEVQKSLASVFAPLAADDFRKLETIVRSSPLIAISAIGVAASTDYRLGFSHDSFVDFHIAQRIGLWILGTSEQGQDFFEFIESPMTSVFVKEYLARATRHPAVHAVALKRMDGLLSGLLERRLWATDEHSARLTTFASGQVAYYLGTLLAGTAPSPTLQLATTSQDFWLRRCTVMGIAFGGDQRPLDTFIDEMRQQIAGHDFTLARQNIAVELAFFGDQPFNPEDPTYDAGVTRCQRLVSTTVLQFKISIERAYLRMALFNLVYLARHRPLSYDSFRATVLELREPMAEMLQSLEGRVSFPEVAELQAILAELASERAPDAVALTPSWTQPDAVNLA